MREFAAALPQLRRAVTRDLSAAGVPRQRALACAVRLLDLGFLRVGGEEYAEANGSYGVATILREHVRLNGGDESSSTSLPRAVSAASSRCAIARRERRSRRCGGAASGPRGPARLPRGRRMAGRSFRGRQRLHPGADRRGFSAKDFRTWHGTVLAAVELAAEGPPRSRSRRRAGDRSRRQASGRGARQHACRLPQLLHRPPPARSLPRRRDDRGAGAGAAAHRHPVRRPEPSEKCWSCSA